MAVDIKSMKIKDIKIPHIEEWCIENNQQDWLIEILSTPYTETIYPYKEITKKDGTKGRKYDTNQPAIGTRVHECAPYVNIRSAFLHKFFPEMVKGKEEKVSATQALLARLKASKNG